MLAQVIAICIFLGMFLLIILDQFERHVITLVSGALVLILVFGVCMHSPAAIWEALNLRSFFTAGFWYGAGEESTAGINWSTIPRHLGDTEFRGFFSTRLLVWLG